MIRATTPFYPTLSRRRSFTIFARQNEDRADPSTVRAARHLARAARAMRRHGSAVHRTQLKNMRTDDGYAMRSACFCSKCESFARMRSACCLSCQTLSLLCSPFLTPGETVSPFASIHFRWRAMLAAWNSPNGHFMLLSLGRAAQEASNRSSREARAPFNIRGLQRLRVII
jgi:hypothetical protein